MTLKVDIKEKIKQNSSMFVNFIKNAITASPKVQNNFLEVTTKVAETALKIIKDADLIVDLNYKGKEFWSINRCKTSCFIDGGVDRTSIISSAPLSIRAGSYIVKPDATSKREFFEESMVFLGDLYDPKYELYDFVDDDFEEDQMLNKKKDGARIIFEAATIVKHILLNKKFDYCFLHGPLEATVMPFTVAGFPTFTKFAVENILAAPKLPTNNEKDFLKKKNYGKVPKYLQTIKKEIEDEYQLVREMQIEDEAELDRQKFLMNDDEKQELIAALKKKWEVTHKEY